MNEQDETRDEGLLNLPDSFNSILPRTIFAEADPERLDKKGATFTGIQGLAGVMGQIPTIGAGNNILRNPSRRFYDPEITTTSIYLPRTIKQKNRWNRWFYDHDELIGVVLDTHAELPYSRAELVLAEEDPYIQQELEDCVHETNFFSMLPIIDLEFMKVGEVFIHTPWDAKKGRWSHIIIHNPDFVEVKFTPFADQECVIELIPDDELKSIVHSTKPENQQLKKRIPEQIFRRVLTGKNITLDPDEVTHIARRSNSYDIRGTSIISRLFRCFVPETKVRMFDGTCKDIKDVVIGDEVLSLHGEKRKVLDTVKYDIDDYLIELKPEKSFETLKSTIGHKYKIRRQYCACGCGEEITYKQMKNHCTCMHGHNLKFQSSLIENSKDNKIPEPVYKTEEVESQSIKPGDCLLVPINNEIGECSLTEGQARLLGYFIAEGSFGNECTKHQSYIEFTFGLHEQETWAKDVIEILGKDFDISPNTYPGYNEKKVFLIRIVRTTDYDKLHNFLRDNLNGNRAWNKELKEKVLYYPKNIQKQILIGAFRGDGQYNRDYNKKDTFVKNYSETIYSTTSKKLSEQFQWLLFRCKYYNYIKPIVPKPKKICSNTHISIVKPYYTLHITGHYSKDFIKECWNDYKIIELKHTELYEKMKEIQDKGYSLTKIADEMNALGYKGAEGGSFCNKTITRTLKNKGNVCKCYQFSRDRITNDENYFYVPVKEINKIKYKGTVHDITVDVNHWWLANDGTLTANTLMYEDKLRESQITVADNFIYPLKIFKLGDPKKGWIPNETHQRALAQMLQQATFDPNFSLIYHYGLSVEYVTVADKLMKLDKEWTEISERKMIALGIGKAFLSGESTLASANVTLQMQMARYKAKRDLFETRWMRDKFFRVLAEKNEWYQRDKKELVGHYRVTRSAEEKKKRVIIPKILWHKKLMMRDDQAFLTFLNNVYAQGKGPLSAITLLQYMGLSLDEELDNKQKQRLLEEKIGALTHPSVGGPTGMGGGSVAAKLKDIFTKKKKGAVDDTTIVDDITANAKIYDDSNNFDPNTKILIGNENPSLKIVKPAVFDEKEAEYIVATTKMLHPAEEKIWLTNLNSPNVPSEVILQMLNLNNKLNILDKKHNGEFKEGVIKDKSDIIKILTEIYKQGKLNAFDITEFFPIYKQYYATNEELTEYSDLVMKKEFEGWVESLLGADIEKTALLKHIRNLGNSCFCYGQLKGFQEQGIYQVKIGNVLSTDGVRYGVKDLLSKGWNVGKIIAPKDEIILLYPCIEGFEDDEFHNNVDPHIIRQKSFTVAGVDVRNCPIEFSPVITRYLNKMGSFIKRKWDVLEFVKDVIDLDEWEETTLKDIQKRANLDVANVEDEKMRSTIEASLVTYERIKKRGSIPVLEHKRKLYISTWLGIEDRSLVDNLIRYVDILDDGTEKIIRKSFKRANYDLSQQELETFSIFGHIEQLSKGASAWYVAKKDDADVDYRVRQGKMWDAKGKCLNNTEKDEVQIFKDNLRLWVDYPHFLDDEIRKSFEALL